MFRTVVSKYGVAVLVAVSAAAVSSGASAGGKALQCYEQAVVPAAYQTVQERVLVRRSTTRVVEHPAVYAYQSRRVVVQPERVSYRTVAPIYEHRSRRVQVQPASVGWEYQMRKGRKILCKVKRPAIYQTVSERVLVKQGGRVAVTQPAIYGTVKEKVLVRPASRQKVHEPAIYKTVSRQVKVRDQQVVWQPVSRKAYCKR
ncbi:hypothetical protein [Roseibium polysiphoniae]|uniref:Uncharacterized protein n=1 Tax=Roseibium polysiphoniae TaxID=2571221 RepID=A0ABR9CB92_9HYPH|nr:hypothetical protein [Roseibium polysiphoniae]MBD8876365.1 hypothetical protein [Roseibium polysiphoniae]